MSKEYLIDHKNHVNEVIDRIGFGPYQLRAFITVGLASFSIGANFSIMTTLPFILEHVWGLADFEVSMLSSSFISGGLVVCLFMIFFGDKFGRFTIMNISLLALCLSAVLSALSQDIYTEAFFRFINGISISCSIYSSSVYILEITPTNIRGAVSVGYWFVQCLGEMWVIVIIYLFNPDLDQDNWREISVVAAAPGLVALLMNFVFLIESPLYEVRNNRKDKGIELLEYMAQVNDKKKCSEIERNKIVYMDICDDSASLKYLCDRHLWTKHFLVSLLWVLVVFGYYGLYFVFPFLVAVSSERHTVIIVTIMCTGIQVVIELLLILMIEMSFLGRKNTLIICAGLGVVSSLIALIYNSGFVFFGGTSLAYGAFGGMFSIIYPYTSELYKTNIRTASLALCNTIARLFSICSPSIFYFIMKISPNYVFFLIIGISLGIIVDTICLKTDTKDKILDNSMSQDNTPIHLG